MPTTKEIAAAITGPPTAFLSCALTLNWTGSMAPASSASGRRNAAMRPRPYLPHAEGDAGGLEADLLRGEDDAAAFRRPEGEACDAPHARAPRLRLDAGAYDPDPDALHPDAGRALDRDAHSRAAALVELAAGRDLHPRQQAERLRRREVTGVVVVVDARDSPVELVAAQVGDVRELRRVGGVVGVDVLDRGRE